MEKRILGKTGIEVTELCFGALPFGPLQMNLSVEDCAEILALALKKGINFVDTAQGYKTYDCIRLAMKQTGIRPVIATKSPAASYEDMEKAIHEALDKMELDYIDIFHFHAGMAEINIYEERSGALQCLKDYKNKGIIKAIGMATHNPSVIKLSAQREDIDVVFPLINKEGRGLYKGTIQEMLEAISESVKAGKGIYFMKVLGGGNLIKEYDTCLKFVRDIQGYSSIAMGMVSTQEVEYNIAYFNGETNPEKLPKIESSAKHFLVSTGACAGCGSCIKVCHSTAIQIKENKKAFIDLSKCVSCGYCTQQCPYFAIRVV